MLGRNPSEPALFQMVDVESLVPANHQLRKIDAVLDLSFVPEVVAECYSANRGRPSIDPELALRMMLLGVLYDLSDRELCDEIQMHAGMRWFCGSTSMIRFPIIRRCPGCAMSAGRGAGCSSA
jgi:transposase